MTSNNALKTLSNFRPRFLCCPCFRTFGFSSTLFCFGRLCIEYVSIQVYGCQNFIRKFKIVIHGSCLFIVWAFLREIDFGRKSVWWRNKSSRVGRLRFAILGFQSLCCFKKSREKPVTDICRDKNWWYCTLKLLVVT